jgi:NADH-quinone oxidoreductase E subunit
MTRKQNADPAPFTFTAANRKKIPGILARYPKDHARSALLPLLHLAQEQSDGWIPPGAILAIARLLGLAPIRVEEVVSFYTLFHTNPLGKYLVQICRTSSCWLCGSDDLQAAAVSFLGIQPGETTSDGLFTLQMVECLGACANAPVVQINDDYYEDLDKESFIKILGLLKGGYKVPAGSLKKRQASKAFDFLASEKAP